MATNASLLPIIPRIFFLYLEPVAITYGMVLNYASRIPMLELASNTAKGLPIPTLFMPLMADGYLFNMMLYGLIILLASPPNKRLVQLHIGILIVADFTHWAGLFATIAESDPRGWDAVFDTTTWSPETWNLATYPIQTLAIKFATLAGLFGKIQG
ncbi:uncharacterized protein GGS22DRAFT_4028 [Annulohypoxylon maeteangense]|uniref:uncharacterized protein n=1 Tax=Annulohypoxylon maeteangense TaxID=1927788 RepID=UPI0020079AC4|nr:uncharacterized protein GGS22DRAFT_4028 [Annulohypoxylon maeteangense]KAI0889783.1 hypothetical protein GGS22DRAFT_4028 [Annulohypoxylon maeteangense]